MANDIPTYQALVRFFGQAEKWHAPRNLPAMPFFLGSLPALRWPGDAQRELTVCKLGAL